MASCRHTDWVKVTRGSRHIRLSDPGRLDHLVGKLKRATNQFPQIVLCVGKEVNRKLVTETISNDSPSRAIRRSRSATSQSSGLTSISLDTSQLEDEHPVFLAGFQPNGPIKESTQPRCHETKTIHNTWPLQQPGVHDAVLTRLLFPFSDLVCLFAEDLGGVDAVLDKIEIWSSAAPATDLTDFARQALPRVCVITFGRSTHSSQIQDDVWRARLSQFSYSYHYSSVQVLRFDTDDHLAFRENVRCSLLKELGASRCSKKKNRVLFNATHLADFFSQATSNLAVSPGGKFSFIAASRSYRPVPPSYPEQIRALLCSRARHGIAFDTVATLIASCLSLDAYPDSCHGK